MNRIDQKLQTLQEKGEKAFITYMTAGLPDMERCKELIRTQEKAGTDVIELGIPFSDPVADGPVIQQASYESILLGTNITKVFQAVEEVRGEGVEIPIVFMLYYNTILHYGVQAFVDRCLQVGVDGLLIPDLPYEEQGEINACLDGQDTTYLLQLVSPISADRIEMITKEAKGFVYCVSSMGVTGQAADFHKEVRSYLEKVKAASPIPIMMGFGIRNAEDVANLKDTIDGAIVGSYFINLMKQYGYDMSVAEQYIRKFKKELNEN
ncbi:tryptophan synthase subunit alpha [Eubacterium oxidoreducens]|uniref:Tryptophan synthase alpha chain n=1 Tax=Eubacterium oxidoreducens TaxID=1732 RepID=A0A1G6AGT1_EUBOX|nr:tryptophan synthase subunit alpha [Eubacterium oxidoreducens]SDB07627.1 tryptophan synthase, alpha chain [Eubacterium oxidoreducens]